MFGSASRSQIGKQWVSTAFTRITTHLDAFSIGVLTVKAPGGTSLKVACPSLPFRFVRRKVSCICHITR